MWTYLQKHETLAVLLLAAIGVGMAALSAALLLHALTLMQVQCQ